MPRRRQLANPFVIGAVTAVLLLPAAPAAAASAGETSSGADHCWVSADTGAAVCADDPEALAVEAARLGVVLVADGVVVAPRLGPALRSSALSAATVVARLYDDVGYGGGSLTVTSSSGCSAGLASLGAYGWNDRASSFRGFSGCRAAVFADEFYGGAVFGYSASASSLGSMNDRASSVRVSG